MCGLALPANGFVAADDSDAIRDAAAYYKQGPTCLGDHRVMQRRLQADGWFFFANRILRQARLFAARVVACFKSQREYSTFQE